MKDTTFDEGIAFLALLCLFVFGIAFIATSLTGWWISKMNWKCTKTQYIENTYPEKYECIQYTKQPTTEETNKEQTND